MSDKSLVCKTDALSNGACDQDVISADSGVENKYYLHTKDNYYNIRTTPVEKIQDLTGFLDTQPNPTPLTFYHSSGGIYEILFAPLQAGDMIKFNTFIKNQLLLQTTYIEVNPGSFLEYAV